MEFLSSVVDLTRSVNNQREIPKPQRAEMVNPFDLNP